MKKIFIISFVSILAAVAVVSCKDKNPPCDPKDPKSDCYEPPKIQHDTAKYTINNFQDLNYRIDDVNNNIGSKIVLLKVANNLVVSDTTAHYTILRTLKGIDESHPKDETKTAGWLEMQWDNFHILPAATLNTDARLMRLAVRNSLGSVKTARIGRNGNNAFTAYENELSALEAIDGTGTYDIYYGEQVQVDVPLNISNLNELKAAPAFIKQNSDFYHRIIPALIANIAVDELGVLKADSVFRIMLADPLYNILLGQSTGKISPLNEKTNAPVFALTGINGAGLLKPAELTDNDFFYVSPQAALDSIDNLPGRFRTGTVVVIYGYGNYNLKAIPDKIQYKELDADIFKPLYGIWPHQIQLEPLSAPDLPGGEGRLLDVDNSTLDNLGEPIALNQNAMLQALTNLILGKYIDKTDNSTWLYGHNIGLLQGGFGNYSLEKVLASHEKVNDDSKRMVPQANTNIEIIIQTSDNYKNANGKIYIDCDEANAKLFSKTLGRSPAKTVVNGVSLVTNPDNAALIDAFGGVLVYYKLSSTDYVLYSDGLPLPDNKHCYPFTTNGIQQSQNAPHRNLKK